jgi:hypothetical protein
MGVIEEPDLARTTWSGRLVVESDGTLRVRLPYRTRQFLWLVFAVSALVAGGSIVRSLVAGPDDLGELLLMIVILAIAGGLGYSLFQHARVEVSVQPDGAIFVRNPWRTYRFPRSQIEQIRVGRNPRGDLTGVFELSTDRSIAAEALVIGRPAHETEGEEMIRGVAVKILGGSVGQESVS